MPKSLWWSIFYIVFFRPFVHCCIVRKPISLEVLFLSTQTYVNLGFRLSLVSRVSPSPSANEGLGRRGGGTTPVKVGWCATGHSPRQSRGLTVWNCTSGAPIQCTSEDLRNVVPCWCNVNVESCLRQ